MSNRSHFPIASPTESCQSPQKPMIRLLPSPPRLAATSPKATPVTPFNVDVNPRDSESNDLFHSRRVYFRSAGNFQISF